VRASRLHDATVRRTILTHPFRLRFISVQVAPSLRCRANDHLREEWRWFASVTGNLNRPKAYFS
jgi:hypothetical protein